MYAGLDEFLQLAIAAVIAGLVRGFSGFGAALVFIPLASAVVEPWRAVILLFVIDGLMSLPLIPGASRNCTWREVAPLSLGAAITVPIGGYFLVTADPTALRWALSALALGAVAVLASGWRYHGAPDPRVSATVGMVSGLLGGMASFYGPPMVIFWLGGQSTTRTVRANIIMFFAVMLLVAGATYTAYGIFKWAVIQEAVILLPLYGGAVWVGAQLFRYASEDLFRRIAYLIITGSAVSSSPAFDKPAE